MTIVTHQINQARIAELISTEYIISTIENGTDTLGNLYYQDFDKVLLYEKNIAPEFFNLKNGMAGEILQKFSNHRVHLVFVGDFSKFDSKSLHDFIYESNKGQHVNFAGSQVEALKLLSRM